MLQRQKVNDYMLMDGTPSKLKQNEEKMESESVLKLRYIIAFIGFLMFLLLSIHRTVMSVAIVAMVNNTAVSHLTKAESCPNLITNISVADNFHQITKPEGDLPWPPHLQGYVLGSYFLGYVITQLPSGILAERFGYKWFLFSASMVTGVLTLLIPPASWFNASTVIAVQAMRGLAQGFVQPSIAILTSNWFPKQERGFLYSFMLSGTCLGTAVASIFTGYICDLPGSWPYSFYVVGIAGLMLSIPIFFCVAESPNVHPKISNAERDFILSNQESISFGKKPKRPWSSMLTSVPVWAFALGYFGHVWALSHFWTVQSTFLGTILHYPIAQLLWDFQVAY